MDEKTAVSGLFLQCNFSILFGKVSIVHLED